MKQVEHRIMINSPAETIFCIYADVSNWNTWDPDTKTSCIKGPFIMGAKGSITPPKGMSVPMLLTSVNHNKNFTVEAKIPFLKMVFEHELIPTQTATEVIHRVIFSGLLSPLFFKIIGAQLNKGLPVTLANLKEKAEGMNGSF